MIRRFLFGLLLSVSLSSTTTGQATTRPADSDLRRIITQLQQQIATLRSDIDKIRSENESLRVKITSLQKQAADANPPPTTQIADALAANRLSIGMTMAQAKQVIAFHKWEYSVYDHREAAVGGKTLVEETWEAKYWYPNFYRITFRDGLLSRILIE